MERSELLDRVKAIGWWHRIDLGGGIVTPGTVDTQRRLAAVQLPADLTGKSVLDIGAWDGFYSFEAERRGASRVLAIDLLSWMRTTWGSKDGFDLAKAVLGSRVEERLMDAMDLSPDDVGMFDVVLYLGVLYHMRHPLLALERVFSVTRELAIIETHAIFRGRQPVLEFYPGRELLGDDTNWYAPNPSALEGMLRAVGFRRLVQIEGPSNPLRRAARTVRQAFTLPAVHRLPYHHGRLIYHAYR